MRGRFTRLLIAAFCALTLGLGQAVAQGVASPEAEPSPAAHCPGFIADNPLRAIPAAFRLATLDAGQVRITYIGHSTFLIESPQLVRMATDYNDYVKPPVLPDIATMNHAHDTHYTDHPDPRIRYVLRGWAGNEKPARIDLTYKDVHVRNVPTNIRTWDGGTERYGNSIFIFEIAGLCIAHLGHLHHTLTPQQLAEIGRVDVVLAPVDGSYTLDLDGMVEVLDALKAPLIIPMHFFGSYTLERFLDRMRESRVVEEADVPSRVLSRATLPLKPTVLVLPGH